MQNFGVVDQTILEIKVVFIKKLYGGSADNKRGLGLIVTLF